MVQRLENHISFSIITRQRDNDPAACPGTGPNQWYADRRSRVIYVPPRDLSLRRMRSLLKDVDPDVVYLTSFFSPLTRRFLIWQKLRLIPRVPCVLAPWGEFSPGALRIKALRKRAYVSSVSRMGLYDDVIWQASWPGEEDNIRARWPKPMRVKVASALTPATNSSQERRTVEKSPFAARFVYLSRIAPVKNLRYAIELLSDLTGDVLFDIYGPLEDETYWEACERSIRSLPPNVRVRYLGLVGDNSGVLDTLAGYHFFLLPTLGENFGYAIYEALMVGCPPIISDRTPWNTLCEHGVGWQLPLEDRDQWRRVLQECIDMPEISYRQIAEAARAFAFDRSTSVGEIRQNLELFHDAASEAHHPAWR
jgi:glycosyltransferase involved in cell wall biosynthesis